MQSNTITRRELAALAAVGAAGANAAAVEAQAAQAGALTARQVIERIQKNVGVPWQKETVDTFKAGDPETPVRGIATSFMSTLDVLQRAVASGRNLVISHEPTFYNHLDRTGDFAGDPIYKFKKDFIEGHQLVVWRFHDHWHFRQPDPVIAALALRLGWTKFEDAKEEGYYTLPETTLGELAKEMQDRLKVRTLRAIGDPRVKVKRVALSPGAAGLEAAMRMLPNADVYVCGDATEWEGIEYARDTIAAGFKKGMILAGHVVTEDPGMELCAHWLKNVVPEVPVEWIPAFEPFWRPA